MELYFKLYACCAFIHPGLDGLLDIQKSDKVRGVDMESIILRFPKSGYKVIDNNALRSHCAQYVLALAATKGYVYFHDILEDQRSDPGIKKLSEHVTVVGDEELDRTLSGPISIDHRGQNTSCGLATKGISPILEALLRCLSAIRNCARSFLLLRTS